jgi:hypothetical protein
MRICAPRICLLGLVLSTSCLVAEQNVVIHVKTRVHAGPKDLALVEKGETLTFDDAHHQLILTGGSPKRLDIAYDDVVKVVFEVTTHLRAGTLAEVIGFVGVEGAIVGNILAGQRVNDYWFYVEYKKPDGSGDVLIEVPKDLSAQVIDKANAIFGSRVTIADFPEKPAEIEKKQLAEVHAKHVLKVNKKDHPVPEVKPDKALVVVVCPRLPASLFNPDNQFKLHANDHVVAINRMGTYGYAYLDPGMYLLVSQAENASGFGIDLEAVQGLLLFSEFRVVGRRGIRLHARPKS